MMQHAASQSMRATANTAKNQELPSLDWHRHDPEEKAFYHALQIQIDRFKMGVDWNGMQNGIAGEGGMNQVRHAPGTMQLDSFSDKNLTGSPPPALAFEDDKPEKMEVTEVDEEERFSDTEWPDLDEHIHADLDDKQRIQETSTSVSKGDDEDMTAFMEGMAGEVRHAAAMELAPSSKASEITLEETIVAQEFEAGVDIGTDDLIRVRILESLPEAIIDAAGEEVTLEVGDVHFLDSLTAEMLVDGGFAKIAAL
jgi:hypothetical protein